MAAAAGTGGAAKPAAAAAFPLELESGAGQPAAGNKFDLELDAAEEASSSGFSDYARVLAGNRHFRLLWAAEMVDNIGSWLSYVATLEMASQLSGGSGLALSAVVLIRFLPSLALAPVCGVVADRLNRVRVLVVAAAADAAVMACLAFVPSAPRAAQTPLLYALLALQFSAAGFYEPARKALVPVLVPAADLHLAATIDSWAWSLTGAVGASVGGLVASRLGAPACFMVDACTYLVAAGCAFALPRALGAPDAATRHLKKAASRRGSETGGTAGEAAAEAVRRRPKDTDEGEAEGDAALEAGGGGSLGPGVSHPERRHHHHQALQPLSREPAGTPAEVPALQEHEQAPPRGGSRAGAAAAAALPARDVHHASGSSSRPGRGSTAALLVAARAAIAEGWAATAEGWSYMAAPANREVSAIVAMKCAAALVWGAIDILNVFFADMPSLQLGDSSTTLGLIFAAVGFGCFVGPILFNRFLPPTPPALRWGVALSYLFFFAGLLLMLLSPSLTLVLVSTVVRSMGSAALWIFSTLLMQKRVPNNFLGRMAAVEGALYTVAEAASSLFGGAAFDVFHLSLHQLLLILTAIAAVEAKQCASISSPNDVGSGSAAPPRSTSSPLEQPALSRATMTSVMSSLRPGLSSLATGRPGAVGMASHAALAAGLVRTPVVAASRPTGHISWRGRLGQPYSRKGEQLASQAASAAVPAVPLPTLAFLAAAAVMFGILTWRLAVRRLPLGQAYLRHASLPEADKESAEEAYALQKACLRHRLRLFVWCLMALMLLDLGGICFAGVLKIDAALWAAEFEKAVLVFSALSAWVLAPIALQTREAKIRAQVGREVKASHAAQ
ncbi:MFS transporter [Micractinium conductrix]|uniref:MFS transporter n=1 Tax=Micractinium conductrix TaxID=554055 RepID=A0A2P6VP72_9CHLO|nr:MFS transporter [Micractinium conductrix]|eukprot:PSC75896.1 MFS transporter [Micractinium conductrix]